uniref:Polymerase nucleotidyl transferase domain-containing protein n=1 Tax=Leersia perrieri TaxID=77586 RepID=A0A0D9VR36_9ORYZ
MVPNGLLPNASAGVTRLLDGERWAAAEKRTSELIARIQPNEDSEGRRRAVYDYVRRLIMNCLSCQVFTFGSVPLKTYLPDGDIDVTAFSDSEELKDTWADLVRDALEHEEKSENAEFRVKEVQYIHAEVKIIKCLVDNIVVDISFNQVGGLCTLCFLEEVDALIGQNHLFKRSIILIKAWCFYESRILGAHHGLISTYALETLVLYIFHVFNNCFTGPLEVLYRFLEFFSNFDWEKFCLSLWGPVPISSLPDMTAEPPRMDAADLLLNKSFLDKCSYAYAVTPRIQESQVQQPFISKHFNVIDPLRTNNNLGRSVSKGNFFRIRSAFSFGAKRLARLLECPKEDLSAEVNQFFTNTWIRHGSGNRPDAPTLSPVHQHPMKAVPAEALNNQRSAMALKKNTENPNLRADQDNLRENAHGYSEGTSQPLQRSVLQSRNSLRTVNPPGSHTHHQKVHVTHANTKVSEQLERNRSDGSMQNERDKTVPNSLFVNDRNGQNRSRFARTRSSPELTDPSVEGYSRGRRTRVTEMERSLKVDYNNRRNNLAPEVSSSHITKSSQDESMSAVNSSSHHSGKAASDSNSVSSSYREDNGFIMNEELHSVSEASEKQQEEQVLVNLMASSKLHDFNGQFQLPMEIPPHFSVAPSPLLAPTGFPQKHFGGIPPTSLIGPPWPNMLVHGFVPPPMSHYVQNHTFAPNIEEGSESEKPITPDANRDDGNNWHEYGVGLPRYFNHQGRDPQMHHFDGKEHSSPNISGAPLERQGEIAVEDNGAVEANYNMFQNQTSKQFSMNTPMGSGNVRPSQPSLSRNKDVPENSWDELAGNTSRPFRDKWGKRPAFVAPDTTHSKSNTGWQTGNASDHIPPEVDGGVRNGVIMANFRHDTSEIITGSGSTTSRTSQVANDFEASQIGMPNPMFAPFLIGPSQQRQAGNGGLTFIQTGPAVPFLMYPYVPGNSDESAPQFERNEGVDQLPVNIAVQNFSSLNNVHHPDISSAPSASSSTVGDPSDEQKPDILNSDFKCHWNNLQYGRSCQNPRPMNHVVHPYGAPPVYMQPSHIPWDGPGRPASAHVNWTPMVPPGQRVFPVMPLQHSSERITGHQQHHGEDAPAPTPASRFRGGTGTYLPNPTVPFRDRHSSSRNHRGSYNTDKGDHSDKEGNWTNSKQRNPGRNYGRNHSERSGMRSDRQTAGESQYDRQRRSYRNDSYRHEAGAQSSGSTNYIRRPGNMMHGDPSLSASNVPTADGGDMPRPTRQSMANEFYGQRHVAFRGGSSHSSPDQPSSPQTRSAYDDLVMKYPESTCALAADIKYF